MRFYLRDTVTGDQFEITGDPLSLEANLKLTPDAEKAQVKMVLLNPASILFNGYSLRLQESYKLVHGDVLRIGQLCFRLHIESNAAKRGRSPETSISTKKPTMLAPIFQKKTEKRPSINGTWTRNTDLMIFTPNNWLNKSLIAGFDLDGTLIKTKSGKTFPINHKDWTFFTLGVPKKLAEFHEKGYSINIFTNQLQAGTNSQTLSFFQTKIEDILMMLDCPIRVFAALKRSINRKPAPGMWRILQDLQDESTPIDTTNSFYVGDAAGRTITVGNKKKNDHSIADRLFALNIGLKFQTPEELFLGAQTERYSMPLFDPRTLACPKQPIDYKFSDNQEVIFMVGAPASGKSTFCKNEIRPRGYIYISRDKMNTWQACCKVLEAALRNKNSVVLDNTHRDVEARQKYLDVIKPFNIPCRCFVMTSDKNLIRHNNVFRLMTDTDHAVITDIIIHSYLKQYVEPTLDEGFTEIIKIDFRPYCENEEHEKLYRMFLLEK